MTFRDHFRDIAAPVVRDALGEIAQFTPNGGGPSVSVVVKFDRLFDVQLADTLVGGVESTEPIAEYLTKDYPDPQHGDQVVVLGSTFKITGVEHDNEFVRVRLEDQGVI